VCQKSILETNKKLKIILYISDGRSLNELNPETEEMTRKNITHKPMDKGHSSYTSADLQYA
jgi:hypothetical protein